LEDFEPEFDDIPELGGFYKIRNKVKPGDIWSFKGHEFFSRLIRIFTSRNHVAGSVSGPQGSRRLFWIEAAEGEVNPRLIACRIMEYHGEVFYHKLKPELDKYRDTINRNLWLLIGRKYDIKGLLKNIWVLPKVDAAYLYCSETLQFVTLNGGNVRINGRIKYIAPAIPEEVQKGLRMVGLQQSLMEQVWQNKTMRPGEYCMLPIFMSEVKVK